MTLADFKRSIGMDKLNFYPSKKDGSTRFVAGLTSLGPNALIVTTKDYDPSKPSFVYPNPVGTPGQDFVVSNTEQKAAAFSL